MSSRGPNSSHGIDNLTRGQTTKMAEPQSTSSATIAHIQSLSNPDDVFKTFDRWNWRKNRAFLMPLIAALGGPSQLSQPNPSHRGISTYCRVMYYKTQTGVQIDLTAYNTWLASRPTLAAGVDDEVLAALYSAAQKLAAESGLDGPDADRQTAHLAAAWEPPAAPAGPSWQQSAPRTELRITREAGSGGASGEAPQPANFAKIIEAVQSGRPPDGIREIPNTIARAPDVTPFGKMAAPRKPWERAAPATQEQERSILDREFPAVEEEANGDKALETAA